MHDSPKPAQLLDSVAANVNKARGQLNAPLTADRKRLILSQMMAASGELAAAFQALFFTYPEPDPLPKPAIVGVDLSETGDVGAVLIRDDFGWSPEPTTDQLADQRTHRLEAGEPVA